MLAPIKKFVCTEDTPVVQTKAGKLRGMIIDDIYTFRGIRYAEAERFMSPKPVTPWEGIVDCQDYGYVSAIIDTPRFQGDIQGPHRYWATSEHCQYLNVWTSEMNPEAKKPVMFWIHGGGFANGSSVEMYAYEGENLARDKDVVVVSVNHRLNIIGYLDLSAPSSLTAATSAWKTSLKPCAGCATTSPSSAATPTTSPSSASPAAAAKCRL